MLQPAEQCTDRETRCKQAMRNWKENSNGNRVLTAQVLTHIGISLKENPR